MNKVLPYALTAIAAVIVLRWLGIWTPQFLSRITGPATTVGFFVAAWPHIRRVIG
jgi:hypothetical protein